MEAHHAFGVLRPADSRTHGAGVRPATWYFVARELALWAAIYPLYLAVRGWSIAAPRHARVDALHVISWERALDLLHEQQVQHLLAPLNRFFALYYMLGFGPVVAAVLVCLAVGWRRRYTELRTLLFIALAIALVVYVAFPTAPPRLVPGLGIADTVGLTGHDRGSFAGVRFDPYAAMPSLHVGWSVLAGYVVFRATSRTWVRVAAVVHPVLITLAVTATGNHYLADSLAGALVAVIAIALVEGLRAGGRRAPPAPHGLLRGD